MLLTFKIETASLIKRKANTASPLSLLAGDHYSHFVTKAIISMASVTKRDWKAIALVYMVNTALFHICSHICMYAYTHTHAHTHTDVMNKSNFFKNQVHSYRSEVGMHLV